MTNETVAYERIKPNSYNPNQMNERQYQAEIESIRAFGFIDPLTVREVLIQADGQPDDRAIIDGEHRWKAFGEVRAKWLAGEFVPSDESAPLLLPYLEENALPVVNLGLVSDVAAKKLTIVLNETRGQANTVDLAMLLADIAAQTSPEEARTGLPYSEGELSELLKLTEFNWDAATQQGKGAQAGNSAESGPGEPFVTLTVLMPQSAHVVWLEAIERVKQTLGSEALALNSDTAIANGQVVEALCAEYLASV